MPSFIRSPASFASNPINPAAEEHLEFHYDIYNQDLRITPTGAAAGLEESALIALNAVINEKRVQQLKRDEAIQFTRPLIDYLIDCRDRGVPLNAIAEDKAWPIFFALLVRANHNEINLELINGYTRDNAKEKIKTFRELFSYTKKDWKWFCNKSPDYLYKLFQLPPPYNIRWPMHILEKSEQLTHGCMRYGPYDWFREWFRSPEAMEEPIEAREFDYTIRDLADVGEHHMQQILRSSKTWRELVEKVRRRESSSPFMGIDMGPGDINYLELPRRAGRSARNEFIAREAYYNAQMAEIEARRRIHASATYSATRTQGEAALSCHLLEEARRSILALQPNLPRAFTGGEADMLSMMWSSDTALIRENAAKYRSPPDKKAKKYVWLKQLPEIIEHGDFKAELLDHPEKLHKESEDMRHCIYRTYGPKVHDEAYVVYHITGPAKMKGGRVFTCGVKCVNPPRGGSTRTTGQSAIESLDLRPHKKTWKHDMTRGKCNGIPLHGLIDQFIDHIVNEVNNAFEEEKDA